MKKLLTLLLLSIFFIACNSITTPKKTIIKYPLPPIPVEKIDIPFRDFGYAYFPSTIIDSQKSLDKFLLKAKAQNNRHGKTLFLKKLQNTKINFKVYNLLFYRIIKGSGSIKLTPKAPKIKTTKKHHVTVIINQVIPEIITSDMAYYGLAYKIGKNIADITFDNGKQKVIIENKASDMIIPKNCKTWFDGCNYCTLIDGNTACTKRACSIYRLDEFGCRKWE